MIACVDVHYREHEAVGACLLFRSWSDAIASSQHVVKTPIAGEYRPGHFFERELPSLMALLRACPSLPDTVIVDGYVWLGGTDAPGLGAHLYDALEKRIPIVGVAKNAFKGSSFAESVVRGDSHKPLYVTAVGMPANEAADRVRSMHGEFRVPTLLKAVDSLSRTG
jgi:deoxyribonuclease V